MQATFGIKNMPKHMHKINNTVSSSKDETLSMSLDIGIPVNTDNPNTAPTNIPKDNNCTLAAARTIAPQNTIVNTYTTNEPTANATLKPFTVKKDINIPTPAIIVDSTCEDVGSGEAVDVQPASLCLNYIICMEGLFPPRR
ncbi:hypothetical protein M918_07105 [Clostridium sp. BL8]|nr:hypothetical protein [Clostridium sp. BL8]EQB87806.1 hypothetical protein M918_07105 [Clostridium sp. BL8]